jgi:hypothetical protein
VRCSSMACTCRRPTHHCLLSHVEAQAMLTGQTLMW